MTRGIAHSLVLSSLVVLLLGLCFPFPSFAKDQATIIRVVDGDTFHDDRHPDLKADYVLANPPFNDSNWRGELLEADKRRVCGVPPAGNVLREPLQSERKTSA